MGEAILFRKPSGPRPKPPLTDRQMSIAEQKVKEATNAEIAASLGLSVGYVKVVCSQMYKRVGVRTLTAFQVWYRETFGPYRSGRGEVMLTDNSVRTSCFE